jgi:hypothetical protein
MRCTTRAAFITGVLLAFPGCGTQLRPVHPDRDLTAARTFNHFPILYAGRSVAGIPLTDGGRRSVRDYANNASGVDITYGYCKLLGSGDSDVCNPPLDIINLPACFENRARYTGEVRPYRSVVIRGVRAWIFVRSPQHADQLDKVMITTGRTTVDIYALRFHVALEAARTLRSVDGSIPSTGRLPQPDRHSLDHACRPGDLGYRPAPTPEGTIDPRDP